MAGRLTLTEADRRALVAVDKVARPDGTFTCSELGEELWGTLSRNPQSYARPAGAVIRRLIQAGYVREAIRPWGDGRSRCCYKKAERAEGV
jgi:hypothetical protein